MLRYTYVNKIKYVLRLTQIYVIIIISSISSSIIILLLATSFGLKSPSSGQYLQKNLKCSSIQYKNVNFVGSHLHSLVALKLLLLLLLLLLLIIILKNGRSRS